MAEFRSDPATLRPSSYAYPDELRIDELTIRLPAAGDIDTIAPAFVDPEVGGEAGLPPLGPDQLRDAIETMIPLWRESGQFCPYLIAEADGTLRGGLALHHLDTMRDALEVGYWLFRDARGRGIATRSVHAATEHAFE